MKNLNIKYQETQISYWVCGTMVFGILFLSLSYLNQWGDTPINIESTIITSSLLLVVLLLFYKLIITIDEMKITATFGIGIIKKSIELEKIDVQQTNEIKTPWYYGIGIRVTPYGTLYNTKPGMAIKLKYKNSEKAFLLGTDNFKVIKKTLLEI